MITLLAAMLVDARLAPESTPALRPAGLRCEYLRDPVGIDAPTPRLSWVLRAVRPDTRDERQTAYQIVVATRRDRLSPPKADLWDSGRVASAQSLQVPYAGRPLESWQAAWWKVRVWDRAGRASGWSSPATWTMGLLSQDDWTASWISDPSPVPPASPAHNGYHSAFATSAADAKWVRIDLGRMRGIDGVRLWPARPYDWQPDTAGFLFPVRYRIEVATEARPDSYRTVVDRTSADAPSPGAQPVTERFPRAGARYVRLTATRIRERDAGAFGLALSQMEVLDGGANVGLHAAVLASDATVSGGWAPDKLTDGDVAPHPARGDDALPALRFRREFTLAQPPSRALVSVSALGAYDLYVNGRRVGPGILAPEWTDYRERVQYQTFDIARLLRKGENVIAAEVGDGWYAGRIGLFPGRGHYGRRPAFRLQGRTWSAGGHATDLATDARWAVTADGPIRASDILDGESYDARRDAPGWSAPGFDEAGWPRAATASPSVGRMVAQPNEPIQVVQELKPVALKQPRPGIYVYDLGQNMVGRARMRLHGVAGAPVTFRHAEMLNDDGTIYTANLRGAAQTDRYVCRGGAETYEPHFTYHGFRYVEVTGLSREPALDDLTGRVFCSGAPEVGQFACSSPLIDRLMRNIRWTQRANLMSTPTDCPQRDERLGWMGDIQAFSQTACFNMDMAAFFTKWLRDVRDAQADDGRFPDFAPHPGDANATFSGVPAWGDAGVIVPWRAYVNYGDRQLLAESYAAARRWIGYVRDKNPDLIWRNGRGNDYNDWLNGDTLVADGWPRQGAAVPNDLFATAFFAYSTGIVAKMAAALDRPEEARQYADLEAQIRAAFDRAFVGPDAAMPGNTQAGYALALAFDLLPDSLRPKALAHMADGIAAYHGHVSTGIQTTHRMLLELTRGGRNDLAYQLLNERTFPSWGLMIGNGATTIWERWDGYVKGRGFQDPGMNSFNHWALGSVGEWVWRVVAGLEPDEAHPGWERFAIHPRPGGGLTWARATYESVRGPIASDWRIERGVFTLKATVPPGCTALVYIPARTAADVTEGGRPAGASPGVRYVEARDGSAVFEVGSGEYEFRVAHDT